MTTMTRLFPVPAALLMLVGALVGAPDPARAQSQEPTPASGMLTGVITESDFGGPIAGAVVTLLGTGTSTHSRADGRFALVNVPVGDHTIRVVSLGYAEGRREGLHVSAGGTTIADVLLSPEVISIEAIVVTPGQFGIMHGNAAAPQTLGREVIETMPGLGEDIYRMVHRLPGVAADDYSAKFTVRGGGHQELLVRLDGLTLFEPFHLKDMDGALSIVDVEAVRGVDLTTGGFSAEYGHRLTGVFDMRTLREPSEGTRTSAGISLTNARIMSTGGFAENRGNWVVSARRGYIDLLTKLIDAADELSPRYHDLLAKVEYQLSPRHVVSANILTARDALTLSDGNFDLESTYGNHYAWVNWRAYPNDAVSVETVASVGRLAWERNVAGGAPGTEISALDLADDRDFHFGALRQEWSWRLSDRHLLKWGAGVRTSRATYDYLRSQSGDVTEGRPATQLDSVRAKTSPSGIEAGGFLSHRVRIADPLTAEVGLRYDRYSQSDESVVSPRVNVAYALGARTTLRAAWGLYHQPQEVYELQVQDGDMDFYRAERAEHRVLGIDHTLAGGINLRAEAYQRVLSRMRPRYENLFNVNSGIEEAAPDRVRQEPTEGEAYGLEVFAASDPRKRLRWSGSYTYAVAEDMIDGQAVARGMDQRHAGLLELGYRPSARWSLSSSWQVRTGRPYTSSSITTTVLPDGGEEHGFVFGVPYGERLAPYHRLDLRVTRRFDLGRNRFAVFLDVFNVYNRENPRGWSSSLEDDGDGPVRIEEGPVMNLPLLPALGLSWDF